MRPLIYTELHDKDPRLAEIRETRFLRELQRKEKTISKAIVLSEKDPTTFGKAIFDRLIARDPDDWEKLWADKFVIAEEFGISLPKADEKRDLAFANSKALWDQFDPGEMALRRPKGWKAILDFRSFVLGKKQKGVNADHYTDSLLTLEVKNTRLKILLPIKKLIIEKGKGIGLVASIPPNKDLDFLRSIGLHLRPELQDPDEYLIPLKVGNYWRYRISKNSSDLIKPDIFEEGLSTRKGATTKTVEVISVDRIGARRLVQFLVSYDDENQTTLVEKWVTTPRQIFLCNEKCAADFSDLDKLLHHLRKMPMILHSPLPETLDVEVPMGQFDDVLHYEQPMVSYTDERMRFPQNIYLKPHVGIVRRTLDGPEKPHELLTSYRLLP